VKIRVNPWLEIQINKSVVERRKRRGESVKSYKIAVIGGDGTGPEVTAEA